ncbi:type VI secretion system Vgr family protein, partial [Paraburkholderia jirisanensis]
GLWSYFEQAPDGQSHTLVITDLTHFCKPLEPAQITFSRSEITSEIDALTQWSGTRTLQSVKYTPVTGDYKSPGDHRITYGQTMPNQGSLPDQMEVYEYTGAYSHLDFDRGDHLNRIRIEEWESRAKRFFGVGGVRRVDAGRWFEFVDHPDHQNDKQQDRSFLIVETRWFVENNLPLGNTQRFPGSLETALEQARAPHQTQPTDASGNDGFFLTQIEAQRWAIPFHSPFEHHKPHMRMQSATVVGPAGEEVYTDALNRIKVKFRWDRLASGDDTSSCWIRVMQSDTGRGYGGVHVPRIGEEIYVDWDGGDCDRPIAIGKAYNGWV